MNKFEQVQGAGARAIGNHNTSLNRSYHMEASVDRQTVGQTKLKTLLTRKLRMRSLTCQ